MPVPVLELLKIPSQRASFFKALGIAQQKRSDTWPRDEEIILKYLNCYMTNEDHQPFFLTLDINDRLLHNCMLNSSASTNVMTKKVMEQLNLRILRPYHNICSMDSRKVEVLGVVKYLQVALANYPYRIITMDIAAIDAPEVWGMLLSTKFAANLGGSIQMDLSYATIPATAGDMVRLYREVERRYHAEVTKKLENDEQIVPQEHLPHFESEFIQPICHFFHHPSPSPSKKRGRFQIDRDRQYSDEQSHRRMRVKFQHRTSKKQPIDLLVNGQMHEIVPHR